MEIRPGVIATLSIWDISLHQRWDFIRDTFYKSTAGAILIFDLMREESFEDTKEWFSEINKEVGLVPFILIGYNIDFHSAVNREEVLEFARNEGGIYIEIGSTNFTVLEDSLHDLTHKILDLRNEPI